MSRILLIENDAAYAAELARALQARGYQTTVTGEGKEGLALATSWRPQAIVLCVELPDMSGYLVCQRLRKDEALRTIPLVLTSADATEKSFADHQKLKVRADDYLLKPYAPAALLEILGHRVGVPEGAGEEEELIRLEDGPPEDAGMPALDLDALGDDSASPGAPLREDVPPAPPGGDELFLDALGGLGEEPASARDDEPGRGELGSGLELDLGGDLDRPVGSDDLDAAAASLPEEDRGSSPFGDDSALGALGDDDGLPAHGAGGPGNDDEKTGDLPLRGASADLLRAAGIKLLDEDEAKGLDADAPTLPSLRALTPPPRSPATRVVPAAAGPGRTTAPAPATGSAQADRLERELAEVRASLSDSRSELLSRESELRTAKDKIAALARRAEEAEAQVREAREKAGDRSELEERLAAAERRAEEAARARAEAERRAAEAERRAGDAEKRAEGAQSEARRRTEADASALEKAGALQRELEKAEAQLASVTAQLTAARAQAGEKGSPALEKRLAELEGTALKNEERVLKAYQKIRADEKVRDKVRKALAIASQLLDEGMAPDPSADRTRTVIPPIDPKS